MRKTNLASWRLAVLTSLGIVNACGGEAFSENNERDSLEEGSNPSPPGEQSSSEGGGEETTSSGEESGSSEGSSGSEPSTTTPTEPTEPTQPLPPEMTGPCSEPETQLGPGLYECENGIQHRTEAARCESELPRDIDHGSDSEFFRCSKDTDCTERPHGYCKKLPPGQFGEETASCQYGCVVDDDCAENQVCDCGSPVGQCVTAHDCKTDADCGDDSLCARYDFFDGCSDRIGYACLTDQDQCQVNADCTDTDSQEVSGFGEAACVWTEMGRMCQGQNCVIGRPFLVEGCERVAPAEERADWALTCEADEARLTEDVGALTAEQSERLALEWTRIALMEHASVAAFARFSLQLLSLGAPASLIEACNQAMVDETLHAQLAFGLASRYGGRAIGPGQLDLAHALDAQGFEAIVLNTVLEGCIGETVAAIEAREASTAVRSVAVQRVLQQIAQDEKRHADLAWQFLRWALSQRPELGQQVQALVRRELADQVTAEAEPADGWLRAHGIISDAERGGLRAAVLREVVEPGVTAMVEELQAVARPQRATA